MVIHSNALNLSTAENVKQWYHCMLYGHGVPWEMSQANIWNMENSENFEQWANLERRKLWTVKLEMSKRQFQSPPPNANIIWWVTITFSAIVLETIGQLKHEIL